MDIKETKNAIGGYLDAADQLLASPISRGQVIFPKKNLAKKRQAVAWLKGDKNNIYQEITSSNPDEKLAALGKAFKEMLEHPLVKKFSRNKIRLYLDTQAPKDQYEAINEIPATDALKCIVIPKSFLSLCTHDELKAGIAHELGHCLHLDLHPRRGASILVVKDQEKEKFADRVSVILSGNPQAAKAYLEKLYNRARDAATTWPKFSHKRWQALRNTDPDRSSRTYPSLNERKQLIDETAARMATPEGYAALQTEIEKELEKDRHKLFKHHYSRSDALPSR